MKRILKILNGTICKEEKDILQMERLMTREEEEQNIVDNLVRNMRLNPQQMLFTKTNVTCFEWTSIPYSRTSRENTYSWNQNQREARKEVTNAYKTITLITIRNKWTPNFLREKGPSILPFSIIKMPIRYGELCEKTARIYSIVHYINIILYSTVVSLFMQSASLRRYLTCT